MTSTTAWPPPALGRGRRGRRPAHAIRGSSVSGLTTLLALTRGPSGKHGVFAARASLYGVVDLAALATGTHQLEARYLERPRRPVA